MSTRRKLRNRPPVERVVPVIVHPDDVDAAIADMAAVKCCAACKAPARHSGRSLYIDHIGDCPALADPMKTLETDRA